MSKSKKPKMATSWEIYNRIIWDSRLVSDVFIAGFEDRVSASGFREKPLAHWAADGDIPWHRIRYIRCKDIVVWDREQHLDLISGGHLPSFAWKNNRADENLSMDKTAIFEPIPVYKYDTQGWQPVEDISKSVKSNSLTIASFNVLHDIYEKEKIQTEKRLPAIVEHLRKCDADIIAIQEATPDLLELLLSGGWVRDYYVSDSIAGQTIQPFGNLLLSRLAFSAVEHEFSTHKKMLVGSWFINGELFQVAVVHLTSSRAKNSVEKRKHQLKTLLNHLYKQPGNYLIVGDFNTRNNLQEVPWVSNFIDVWQELRPSEAGNTFNPQINPLAELMSLEGEAARFDRILLSAENSSWAPQYVNLFACEPVENTQGAIFPSDHFGIRAVVRGKEKKPHPALRAPLSLLRRGEQNFSLSYCTPLSLKRRGEQNLTPSYRIPFSLTRRGERGEVIQDELNKISPVYRSAIAIIPPDDLLPAIQAIRQRYDSKFKRWMPHINLIYGFLPESYFDQAGEIMIRALTQIQPFTVNLNNFETFTHRKSCTAWLNPIAQPETALQELQSLLQSLFPQCNEQSRKSEAGFTPHLSVGQFSTPEEALTKLPQWHPRSFTVKSIALISRRGDEPFKVRRIINLGKQVGEETISADSELINLVNKIEPLLNQAQLIQRDTVLEIVSQACKECLGFQPTLELLGSYRLGVESRESDLDVVCQIPQISGENFLKNVEQRLTGLCESIQLVKDAKVPLLRLKLEGISIDLLYARVENWELGIGHRALGIGHEVLEINKIIQNPKFDMPIIGCWEADLIVEFVSEYVPFDLFRLLLRAVRGWAKSRRIYGNSWGFLGGFSFALLCAWSCQYCDKDIVRLDELVANFFQLLSQQDWHQPIALTDSGKQYSIQLPRDLLPIITSIEPCQNSARNVTHSTAKILRNEFARGAELSQEIIANKLNWSSLFESVNLQQESDSFLVLTATSNDSQELEKYCGIFNGSIIGLIIQLEHNNIFVRPWTGIDQMQNNINITLGLNLISNSNLDVVEQLVRDFISQLNCQDIEMEFYLQNFIVDS